MARKPPKRKNLKSPGKCVFCGDPGLTKEHIFPAWMHPLFKDVPRWHAAQRIGIRETEDGVYRRYYKSETRKQGSIFTQQIRVVCGKTDGTTKCNGTWMSVLEKNAKPPLTALIHGDQIILQRRELLTISTWIATKVVVAEYANPKDKAIPQNDRIHIWKMGRPPSAWKIWIGQYLGTDWAPAQWRHHGFKIDWVSPEMSGAIPMATKADIVDCNSQSTSFVIGQLFFHVVSSARPTTLIGFDGSIAKRLQQIWPLPKDKFLHLFDREIRWPPRTGLVDDDLAFIADAYFNYATRIPSLGMDN